MVKLYVHCPSYYHIHVIFDSLHPLMELVLNNSGTALFYFNLLAACATAVNSSTTYLHFYIHKFYISLILLIYVI